MAKRNSKIIEVGPSVWLAAFGKHPGWNDHIDDLGIETDRLVAVKRLLYVEGIRKVIDGGLWDALKPEQHLDGFGHSFLWRGYDGLVVGRMWSSTDGKGRGRYPMIVCCQLHGVPHETVCGVVLPRLKQLEADCVGVGNSAAVIGLVDAARTELADAAASAPRVTGDALPGTPGLVELAADAPEGVGKLGVTRVLYQVEREFSAFVVADGKSGSASRSRTLDVRPQQMRVPAVGRSEEEIWSLWGRALLTRFDPLTSMLLISRDGTDWLDVLVGDPGPAQLVCLQATTQGVPLTTDIPYVIDDAFESGVAELLEAARNGEVTDQDLGYVAAPRDRIAAMSRGLSRRNAEDIDTPDRRPLLLGVAAAVVAVVVIAAIVMIIGGGGSENADGLEERPASGSRDTASGNAGAGPEGVPAVAAPPSVVGPFVRWCEETDGWFLAVASISDLDGAGAAYINESVLGPIEAARDGGTVLDPRAWVSNAPPSRQRLAELARSSSPPGELLSSEAPDAIAGALDVIDRTRRAISPQGWPAAGLVERLAARCAEVGLDGPSSALRAATAGLGSNDQAEVIASIRAISASAASARRAAEAIERIDRSAPLISGSGDAVLASFPVFVSGQVGGAMSAIDGPADIGAAVDRLESLASLADDLQVAVAQQWPTVDRDAFADRSGVHAAFSGAGGVASGEMFDDWLAQVGSPEYREIDPSLDPRRAAELAAGLDRLRDEAGVLRGMLPESATGVMASIDEAISELATEREAQGSVPWNRANERRVREDTATWLATSRALLDRISGLRRDAIAGAEDRLREMRSRDTVSVGGFGRIDETWRARRAAIIASYESDGDVEALHNNAVELEAFLVGIEAAVAAPGVEPGPGVETEALVNILRAERERVVRDALDAATWAGTGYTNADAVMRRAASDYEHSVTALSRKVADARLLADRLARFEQLDDGPDANGDTVRGLAERVASENPGGAFQPVLAQVEALELVEAERDRAVLRSTARGSGGSGALALAAWQRLGELADPVWPSTAAELRQEIEIGDRIAQRVEAGLPDGAAAVLLGTMRDESARRWHTLAGVAGDAETWQELARRAERFGISRPELPPRVRWNLAVAELESSARATGEDEAALRAAAVSAWQDVGPLNVNAPGAEEWKARLAAIASDAPEQAPPLNPAALGPGRVGWRVEEQSESRVVYSTTADGSPVRLAFRLVEPNGGEPFFLSENEASVAVLLAALASTDGDLVRSLLPEPWTAGTDSRRGPRSWTWGGTVGAREPVVSRDWIADSPGRIEPYYAESIRGQIDTPTAEHPLNRISSAAAAMIARAIGCRLPSTEEWRAAYLASGGNALGAVSNRRDATWLAQHAYMTEVAATGRRPDWPDVDIGMPGGYRSGRDTEVFPGSDGVLWFSPVTQGQGPFLHLVGNVSEWTATYHASAADLRGDVGAVQGNISPDQVVSAIRSPEAGIDVTIVGGSALSPSSRPADDPFDRPGRNVRSIGYADVGFRPAFSLAGQSAARSFESRVRLLLRDAPYVRGDAE